jgi:hypothetical protein
MSDVRSDSEKSKKSRAPLWVRRKHLATFLLKFVIGVPLLVFSFWLLKLVYFPEFGFTALMEEPHLQQEHQVFQNILQSEEVVPKNHFHLVDHYITDQPEPYRPLCYLCHGNYPHSKGKEVRSLLNMHSGFMACSVCHVRQHPTEEKYYFVWVDRQTGRISMGVEGGFGRYPAKIFPMLENARGEKKIFRPVSEQAAEEFIRLKTQFTPDQMAQAKRKLHQRLAEKPVFCSECHKKDGYFNFAQLNYPKNRINYLSSNEIARMIEHYKTFYIPEVIDFGEK